MMVHYRCLRKEIIMTADELRVFLNDRGVKFAEGPVQSGVQFRCKTKGIFNVFETGAMSFQGKQTPLTAAVKASVWKWSQKSPYR